MDNRLVPLLIQEVQFVISDVAAYLQDDILARIQSCHLTTKQTQSKKKG